MESIKRIKNSKAIALLYVIVTLSVLAVVCTSLVLVATNLQERTATAGSEEQAFLLAKMAAQTFVAQYSDSANDNSFITKIIEAMEQGKEVSATISFSYDLTEDDYRSTKDVSKNIQMAVRNTAVVHFRLDDSVPPRYVYADVTTTYKGSTQTVTAILSGLRQEDKAHEMESLFKDYSIYCTNPDGMTFSFDGKDSGNYQPSVFLYQGRVSDENAGITGENATYYLNKEIYANLTTMGDIVVTSRSAESPIVPTIHGDLKSYGSITMRRAIVNTPIRSKGDVVLHLTEGANIVTGYSAMDIVQSQGTVTIYGGVGSKKTLVGSVRSNYGVTANNVIFENGSVLGGYGLVKLQNCELWDVSSMSEVILENCVVHGNVSAGKLTMTNTSVQGSVSTLTHSEESQSATITCDYGKTLTIGSSLLVGGDLTLTNNGTMSIGTSKNTDQLYVGGALRKVTGNMVNVNAVMRIAGGQRISIKDTKGASNGEVFANYLCNLNVDGTVILDSSIPLFVKDNYPIASSDSTIITGEVQCLEKSVMVSDNAFGTTTYSGTTYGPKSRFETRNGMLVPVAIEQAPFSSIAIHLTGATVGGFYLPDSAGICIAGGTVTGSINAGDVNIIGTALTGTEQVIRASGDVSIVGNGTINADISTLGNLYIGQGITIPLARTINVLKNTVLRGHLVGSMRIGDDRVNSTFPTLYVADTAELTDDSQKVHLNGHLYVYPTSLGTESRSKGLVISTANGITKSINGTFGKVDEGGVSSIFVALATEICTFTRFQSDIDSNPDPKREYLLGFQTSNYDINIDNSVVMHTTSGVIYVPSSTTVCIKGNLYTKSPIVIGNNARLHIEGSLYAPGVYYSADVTGTSTKAVLLGATTGANANIKYLTVDGDVYFNGYSGASTLTWSQTYFKVGGDVYINPVSPLDITLSNVTNPRNTPYGIGGSFYAPNCSLTVNYMKIEGDVFVKTLTVRAYSTVFGDVYVSGDSVVFNHSGTGYAEIGQHLYAPNANVQFPAGLTVKMRTWIGSRLATGSGPYLFAKSVVNPTSVRFNSQSDTNLNETLSSSTGTYPVSNPSSFWNTKMNEAGYTARLKAITDAAVLPPFSPTLAKLFSAEHLPSYTPGGYVDWLLLLSDYARNVVALAELQMQDAPTPLMWEFAVDGTNTANTIAGLDKDAFPLNNNKNPDGSPAYLSFNTYELKNDGSGNIIRRNLPIENMMSVKKWAGITTEDAGGYSRFVSTHYTSAYSSNTASIQTARANKDMLILSRDSLGTVEFKNGSKRDIEKRPVGIMFFESGFVDPAALESYTDRTHTTSAINNARAVRDNGERDKQGRWIWGIEITNDENKGDLHPDVKEYTSILDAIAKVVEKIRQAIGKAIDWIKGLFGGNRADDKTKAFTQYNDIAGKFSSVSWVFYTCTNPADPYGSNAKDLHIVLPKHTYITWARGIESTVNIIGNGRVFLYLQEDTNIKVKSGSYLKTTFDPIPNWGIRVTSGESNAIFGGVRSVLVDKNTQQTVYDEMGQPYMDSRISYARSNGYSDISRYIVQQQPRMYIVGLGPNITFEVDTFTLAAYVYMPSAKLYPTFSQYQDASKYPYQGNNVFIASSWTAVTEGNHAVIGMYVCDQYYYHGSSSTVYNEDGGQVQAYDSASTVRYYPTYPDLSPTKINGNTYSLDEFWDYPPDTPLSGRNWHYYGLEVK